MLIKLFLGLGIIFSTVDAQACFPKDPMTSFNTPERYKHLPGDLIDVLRKSYLQHTKSNDYLVNAFWSSNADDKCTWPPTLWDALDTVGPKQMYAIVSVYQHASADFVWTTVGKIKNIWYGTSMGFTFEGTDANDEEMVKYLKSRGGFCKDSETISKNEHNGQICWRQIKKNHAGAGLHFCYGAGRATEVHVDYNQVAIGHIPFSDNCIYDPIAVYKHYKDLKGPVPNNSLDGLDREHQNLLKLKERSKECNETDKLIYHVTLTRMLERVNKDKIMAIATLGDKAPKEVSRVLAENLVDKANLFRATSCRCNE